MPSINPDKLLEVLKKIDLIASEAEFLSKNYELSEKLEMMRTQLSMLIISIDNIISR